MLFSTAVVLFLVVAGPILSSESAQDRQAYAAWLGIDLANLVENPGSRRTSCRNEQLI